jgi:hypothetical protein
MLVVSVAAQLLMPKPKSGDGGRSPNIPTVESSVPLPQIWGKSKIAGALFYSTPPKRTTNTVTVGKGSSRKQEQEAYVCDLVGYALTAGNSVKLLKLELNGEVVYEPASTNPDIIAKTEDWQDRILFRSGAATQSPLPELVAIEGSNTPAFKGMSYIMIENLNLSDYGNQYPTIKAVLQSEIEYPHLERFFIDLVNRSGTNTLANSGFGLNILTVDPSLSTLPFVGCALMMDGKDFRSLMQPLMEFFQLYIRTGNNHESIITLPAYNQLTVNNITSLKVTDLLGSGDAELYTYTDESVTEVPNELALTYIDYNTDFEPETSIAKVSRGQVNSTDFTFNYVYDRNIAQTGASRLLRNFWLRKAILKISLPIRFLDLVKQGQIVTFTDDEFLLGKNWIVNTVTIGDNGYLDISLNRYSPTPYVYKSGIGIIPFGNIPTSGGSQAEFQVLLIDSTTMATEASRVQPYLAVSSVGYTGTYYVYESTDNINFSLVHTGTQRTATGTLVNAFTVDAHHFYPSYDEVITVSLSNPTDTLSSVTEDQFWLGQNVISIDKQLVSYRTATLISPGIYELRGFMFGAWDSEPLIGITYPAGTKVAQIKKPGFQTDRPTTVTNNVQGLRYYKVAASPSTDILTLPTFPVNYDRNIGKALAPVVLNPVFDFTGADAAYYLEWIPRTNNRTEYYLEDEIPLNPSNPDGELYRVRIYDITNTLIHTEIVPNARNFSYQSTLPYIRYTVEQNSGQANIGWGFVGQQLD